MARKKKTDAAAADAQTATTDNQPPADVEDVAAGAEGLVLSEDAVALTDPCVRCGIAAKVQDGDRVVCTYCGAE